MIHHSGKILRSVVIVLFAIFTAGPPSIASGAENAPASDTGPSSYDALAAIAGTQGKVRLIVKLTVPGIEVLTAQSTMYGAMRPGETAPNAGASAAADAALEEAISRVTGSVVTKLAGTEYAIHRTYSSVPFLALEASAQALAVLETLPEVQGMEEDIPVPLVRHSATETGSKGVRSAPASPAGPMLDDTVGIIGASAAWGAGHTGAGWYVAVMDTGIRKTHEFFAGKTIVEACYALGEDGSGPAGDCPNGLSTMTGSGAAAHHPNTYASYDHGSHVSGIATGDAGALAGVARDANLIAVQVFSKFLGQPCSPCVLSWSSDQLAGLDYVYSIRGSYPIASVNMSLGGGYYTAPCDGNSLKPAIDNLRAAGIGTAIATGNDGYCGGIGAPACISSCIAVGSSTKTDEESGFNNWHATLQELFAPGSSIYSSTGDSDASYASWNGTSMATPHVAGSLALMKHARPGGTVDEFFSALQSTGAPVVTGCGTGESLPRIQVDDAITSLTPVPLPEADYNGDGSEEIGVFRNGMWFLRYSPDYSGLDLTRAFGSATPGSDAPQIGEFGCVGGGAPDGLADLAILRGATSTWQATLSPDWGSAPDLSVVFGTTSHKRIATRWLDTNGDGCSDIGVYKNGCFDILESPDYTPPARNVCFGLSTDEPLSADLNGDGQSDLILWRSSTSHYTYRLSPDYSVNNGADLGAGEVALLGDVNGDGSIDLGSYKPAFSTFRFVHSPDFSGVDLTVTHGVNGDIPLAADVNGDGATDIGIFRNSVARWWFRCSPGWASTCLSQSFGVAGDVPIYGKPVGIP